MLGFSVVYYELLKRELKTKTIYEYRWVGLNGEGSCTIFFFGNGSCVYAISERNMGTIYVMLIFLSGAACQASLLGPVPFNGACCVEWAEREGRGQREIVLSGENTFANAHIRVALNPKP